MDSKIRKPPAHVPPTLKTEPLKTKPLKTEPAKTDAKQVPFTRDDELTLPGDTLQASLKHLSPKSLTTQPGNAAIVSTEARGGSLAATSFTVDNLAYALPKLTKALGFDSTRSKATGKEILDDLKGKWAALFPTEGSVRMEGGVAVVDMPASVLSQGATKKGFIFNGHPAAMIADALREWRPGQHIDLAKVRAMTKAVAEHVRTFPSAHTTLNAIFAQAMWWAQADTQVRGGRDWDKNWGANGRLSGGLTAQEKQAAPVTPMDEFADYVAWVRDIVLGKPEDKERIYSNHPIVLLDPFTPEEQERMWNSQGPQIGLQYDDGERIFGYMGYYKLGNPDAKSDTALRPFAFGFTNNKTDDGQPVYRTMITVDREAGMVATRYEPSILDDLQAIETLLGHDNEHFVINQHYHRAGQTLPQHWLKLNEVRWENKTSGRGDIKEAPHASSVYDGDALRVANNEYDALLAHHLKVKVAMQETPELAQDLVRKSEAFEKKVIHAAESYARDLAAELSKSGGDPRRAQIVKQEIVDYFMEIWLSRNVMFLVDPTTIPVLDRMLQRYPFCARTGTVEEKPGPNMFRMQSALYSGQPAFPGSLPAELQSYLDHARGVAPTTKPTMKPGPSGTFSKQALDALPPVRVERTMPWNLERTFALRDVDPKALALALAKNANALFRGIGDDVLGTTKGGGTALVAFSGTGARPTGKASESDYYDTPSFDLFHSDPTMAVRTKIGFSSPTTAKDLEVQVLSSSQTVGGIDMKAGVGITNKAPTPNEAGTLEKSFLTNDVVWQGERKALSPLKHVQEQLKLAAKDLVLESKMHYRGSDLRVPLARISRAALEAQLTAKGALPWTGPAGTVDELERRKAIVDTRDDPGLRRLWFMDAEQLFVPGAAGKGASLVLQQSSVIDPAYWSALPPEQRTPAHVPPDDVVKHGWLRIEAALDGGFAPHVARIQELEARLSSGGLSVVERKATQKLLEGARMILAEHQNALAALAAAHGDDVLKRLGMGGRFALVPEPGSRFSEWSPRKEWFATLGA